MGRWMMKDRQMGRELGSLQPTAVMAVAATGFVILWQVVQVVRCPSPKPQGASLPT